MHIHHNIILNQNKKTNHLPTNMNRCNSYLLTLILFACTLNSQLNSCSAAGLRGTTTSIARQYSMMNNTPRIALQKVNVHDNHEDAFSSSTEQYGNRQRRTTSSRTSFHSKLSVLSEDDASNVHVGERQQGDTVVREAVVDAFY